MKLRWRRRQRLRKKILIYLRRTCHAGVHDAVIPRTRSNLFYQGSYLAGRHPGQRIVIRNWAIRVLGSTSKIEMYPTKTINQYHCSRLSDICKRVRKYLPEWDHDDVLRMSSGPRLVFKMWRRQETGQAKSVSQPNAVIRQAAGLL